MNAIIKRFLIIGLSFLCIRCMCYCPLPYNFFLFSVESDLSNFSVHQIEPIFLNTKGDTLRLSSSYSTYKNNNQVYWTYDYASDIVNQRIVFAMELKNDKDSVISVMILDTLYCNTDLSYSYYAYARQNSENRYTYKDKFSIANITGDIADTLFLSKY